MRNLHTLAAAVSLALAAGNAGAALVVPGQTTGGQAPSSILFAATDTNSGSADYLHTFYYDLALGDSGLNYASFVNGTEGANGTLTWDLSKVSTFANFLPDLGSLKWSVVGGYNKEGANFTNLDSTGTNAAFSAVAQWGLLSTAQVATDYKANGALNISNSLVSSGSVGAWLGAANNYALTGQASNTVDQGQYSATQSYYDKYFPSLGAIGAPGTHGPNTVGAGSDSFFWVTNPNLTTSTPNTVTELGSFSLGANGVLSYQAAGASAVPVPASAWLFASGLLGALGLKRREQKLAA